MFVLSLVWISSAMLHGVCAQVTPQASLDVYPDTGTAISLGTRTVFVCRVLGVTAGTQLTYAWACPDGSCSGTHFSRTREDVLEVDVFADANLIFGAFTCTVTAGGSSYSASHSFDGRRIDGPGFESVVKGPTFDIDVIPTNSFVTDPSIPADNFNRAVNIRCSAIAGVSTDWYLDNIQQPTFGVGQTHLALGPATMIPANDEYECRLGGGQTGSYYVGLYLTNGALSSLSPPSNLATSSILANSLTVYWDAVTTATLYYVGYSIQGFGIGTEFPPLFERVVGSTSVTLTGLTPSSQYVITVWSSNGAGVSAENSTITARTTEQAPSQPRSLTIISSSSVSLALNWLPPRDLNGAVHYTIEYSTSMSFSPTPQSVNTTSSSTHYTVDIQAQGIPGGTTYYFRVVAVNSAGRANNNNTVNHCYDAVPDTPGSLNGTAEVPSSVMLTWAAPEARVCDGSGITGYTIMYRLSSASSGAFQSMQTTSTSLNVTGLVGNAMYDVQVVATSSVGSSTAATATVTTGAGFPGSPGSLQVSSGFPTSTSIAVMWTAPTENGGSPVTGYNVTATGQPTVMVTVPTTSTTISGLNENTEYTISVAAVNSAGTGTTVHVVERTLLSAPSIMAPSPGGRSASLSWTSTGSLFTVNYRPQGEQVNMTMSSVTAKALTLMNLTPVTTYDLFISGFDFLNRLGEVGTAMFTTTAAAPTAPQGLSVTTISSSSITVSWTVPVDNGGAAITRYNVMVAGQPTVMVTAPTTSTTISGLNENTEYAISVAAVNSAGTGTTAQVVERTLLSAPSNIVATPLAGGNTASLSWASTGSLFTVSYRPQQVGQANISMSNVTAKTLTLMNLIPLTIYGVFISGLNSNSREGEAGTATFTTLAGPPSVPLNLTVLPLSSSALSLSWAEPASDGGSPVTNYQISFVGGSSMEVSTTSTTISGLNENTEYTISVAAVNSAGTGTTVEITGGTLLSAPSIMTPSPGGRSASLSWTSTGSLFTVSYRPLQEGQSNMTTPNVATKTLTLLNLTPVTTYKVFISGFDSLNRPGEVGTAVFTTTTAAPLAPILGTFTLNSSAITFTWAPPADIGGAAITNYIVTATGQPNMMVNAPTTSTTISGLNENTEYTISVAAVNSAGTGPTAQRTETTLFPAPTGVASNPGYVFERNAIISWNPTGRSFRVIVSTGGMEVYNKIVSQHSVVLTSLVPGTDYTVQVSQVDANNRSGEPQSYEFRTVQIETTMAASGYGTVVGVAVLACTTVLFLATTLVAGGCALVLYRRLKASAHYAPESKDTTYEATYAIPLQENPAYEAIEISAGHSS